MNTHRIAIFCCLLALPLAFQNCSDDVGFGTSSTIGVDSDNNGIGDGQNPGTEDSVDEVIDGTNGGNGDPTGGPDGTTGGPNSRGPSGGGGTAVVTPNPMMPPTIVTGNVVRNEMPSFDSCQSYQELVDDGQPIELPAKSGNNICYYMKIFDDVPSHRSGTMNEERASDVLSSNHFGNYQSYIAPFVMGDKSVSISSGAMGWQATLSGAFDDPTEKLAIDNYFMVHVTSLQNDVLTELTSAFGTADAVPGPDMPILYKNIGVDFTAFARGGTARVEAIGLETSTDSYDLRVQGLDCGGGSDMNDTYLVFH